MKMILTKHKWFCNIIGMCTHSHHLHK